jgi:DNA modification methylase
VGYGNKKDQVPSFEMFGCASELVPDTIGGDHVQGKFDTALYGMKTYTGSVFAEPMLPNRTKLEDCSNKYEASLTLYDRIWNVTSNLGDWVGDLCSGSGAGSIAALLKGRNVMAFDKDKMQVAYALWLL